MQRPLKFGKYLLLERIAVGGMAEVYAAKSFGVEGFERILAIKKILPTLGEDPEFVSMFVDEARIAVQLSHANIVQVLELGKHDDSLYIAMEYVAGRDVRHLAQRYRRSGLPMPIPQACAIVARACEALDHAHRKCDASGKALGIVHRDVSPQNVLVSFAGDVKLIDFGIAKAESRLQRTHSGTLKGKFSYMSPEQVHGESIDRRSDVFSAGVLLWELLCGRKLFTGENDLALLDQVRRAEVPPPRSLNPEIPEALESVVLKALAVDRGRRHQWCSELHDDLVRFAMVGETVFGSRRLSDWMREQFRDEYEQEQGRLRQWLAVRVPVPGRVHAHEATTIPALADSGVARALVRETPEWRVVPERDAPEQRVAGRAAPEQHVA
ncbi:MAG TPA: serine/threonine-protein kinase, partial [Myxococcales bacterium]|nr:serine/threonine-protein kinase [Myxococcales bacterium]